MSKEFNYAEWLMAGVIDGYKTGAITFCETTDRAERYKTNGSITQAQANEIGMACPKPEEVIEEVIEETESPIEEEIDEGEGT